MIMRNSLIIILILFCGVFSFSQDITIDGNGIVKCPSAPVGASETISGKTYYVVNKAAIISILDTGSFTVTSSTISVTDLSCVCTTQITEMDQLFNGRTTFNDDISNWDTSNVISMNETFRGRNKLIFGDYGEHDFLSGGILKSCSMLGRVDFCF